MSYEVTHVQTMTGKVIGEVRSYGLSTHEAIWYEGPEHIKLGTFELFDQARERVGRASVMEANRNALNRVFFK